MSERSEQALKRLDEDWALQRAWQTYCFIRSSRPKRDASLGYDDYILPKQYVETMIKLEREIKEAIDAKIAAVRPAMGNWLRPFHTHISIPAIFSR